MTKKIFSAALSAIALIATLLVPVSPVQAAAHPDAPLAPTSLSQSNLTVLQTPGPDQGTVEVDFSWNQPETGPDFTGWTFQITDTEGGWPLDSTEPGFYHSDFTANTSLHWIGLQQGTTYFARVAMTTGVIDPSNNATWNWSNVITFTTPDVYWTNRNKPSITGFTAASAVISKGPYYFELEWDEITENYHWNPAWALIDYEVEFRKVGNRKWQMTDSTFDPYFLFDNILDNNTRYQIRVTPWYVDSRGAQHEGKSKTIIVKTDVDGPPAYVLDTTVKKIKCASGADGLCQVKISWNKPRRSGGYSVTSYEVRYRVAESGDIWTSVIRSPSKRFVYLRDLAKGKVYEVSIKAFNSLGALEDNSQLLTVTSSGRISQLR